MPDIAVIPHRAAGTAARPRAAGALTGARVMTARAVRLSFREVDGLLTSLMLPVMLMLMFVYLFGGAIDTGTAYVTYVVPGVLLLCAGFGSSMTAVRISEDLKRGVIDRFRTMDVGGTAMLASHVAASAVRNSASTILVFGVAFLIGFRPRATVLDWLAAAGVLLAFVVAISWVAAAAGLLAKSPESAGGFTFFMMFLPYASSAFVPIDTMPSWIHGFARHQPVTPVIETLRGLLLDRPLGDDPWLALAWCGGITLVSVVVAALLFARRTS